jgi:serine/threonine protein kinase
MGTKLATRLAEPTMDPALGTTSSTTILFEDPLGERRPMTDPNGADTLELFSLKNELTAVSSVEFALRERVSRLANFRHAYYARVRGVERLKAGSTLALVSERTAGVRLANVLEDVEQQRARLDIHTALSLLRQLVPAVALLHENVRDVAHGAIGCERLVLTPNGRLVVVEHVLGAALEQLRYSPERYWNELGIAVPRSTGPVRLDHRTDIIQMGVVALELVLGRRLRKDEYPARAAEVVGSAWAISATGGLEPLPPGLRSWLMRALQLEPRSSFGSMLDARTELERMLGGGDYAGAIPQALETFVAQYYATCRSVDVEPRPVAAVPDPENAPTAAPVAAIVPLPDSTSLEHWTSEKTSPPSPYGSVPAALPESEGEPGVERNTVRPWYLQPRMIVFAVAALVLVIGVIFAGRRSVGSSAAVATGSLTINSNPAGAPVTVDSEPRGVTPVTLALKAGPHVVELRGAGAPRSIPVTIAAGAEVSQYIELPKEATTFGQLQVRTEPAGARVSVDGLARGPSPLTIPNLAAGAHTVVLENNGVSVKQEVNIEAGVTASLLVPLAAAPVSAPVSGWVSVTAPVEMQLYENGRLLGTTQSEKVMVPAGKHDIEITNQPLAFRVLRSVQIAPGKATPISVVLPKQRLAINALPWAEVSIDGQRIGETPLGDLSVLVGPHEIVFRHPELGEQKHAITVTAAAPARLSVDLRKK